MKEASLTGSAPNGTGGKPVSLAASRGVAYAGPRSRWPARLDLAQSVSGLLLALFMWGHMFFVSSILLGKDAMWTITKLFEGYFFFGRSFPWLVSIVVGGVFALLIGHAALAVRKFPIDYRQYRIFKSHMNTMKHEDTTLWFWQVLTGFAMFFLAPAHLFVMLSRPDRIGPFESADRVWSDHFWPLYILLLLAVELHGGIGLYRLAVKWGWFEGSSPEVSRKRLKQLKWALTVFFLALGVASLAAYIKIGIEHAPQYGQHYVPSFLQQQPAPAGVKP